MTDISENPRKHGQPPYNVAVVHGGPGWAGEMAPVARELAPKWGVLEPFQTANSLEGQVQELHAQLQQGSVPVTLIGFSWGAMLSIVFTARYPADVRKLILVSTGALTERQAATALEARRMRLTEKDRQEARALHDQINNAAGQDVTEARNRLTAIFDKTELVEEIDEDVYADIPFQVDMARAMAKDVTELRRTSQLIRFAETITCPVVAVHGDYDPLPADALRVSLSKGVKDFRLVILARCGHIPWIEKHARDKFFEVLNTELAT